MIRNMLLVALGGAVGSVVRYLVGKMVESSFPWATLLVNIVGSVIIGVLVGLVSRAVLSADMKLMLMTGFCGGLTTFSTFANESLGMMKAGNVALAAVYVAVSVALGILGVWMGMKLAGE